MKQFGILLLITHLCLSSICRAQENDTFYFESGVQVSIPVHIMMYRSHRLAVGANFRIMKPITEKTTIGIRADYEYRFTKINNLTIVPDSTLAEQARYRNFIILSLKPNVQFKLQSNWFLGIETGVGYAISDANKGIGLGFVSEFAGPQRFGLCSNLFIGKHFNVLNYKMNLTLYLSQYLAHGHAENALGLRFNYQFNKL
ncbi:MULTISPECIES: hypothetical protein [Flavobacterium]|uniref:Lipid A 3-O-deacylase (PagL) n=1 Tax=Flavobacterium keumense TaxID=1306518 RepID=A0ABY8N3Z6_9FLAO|nr:MULTISPECIES: hypothetical protein [Flavobacterium]WGK94370.1 hypothetical protein MG292_09835 [Flavobacterium keumense]